ncbi:hypothetical protein EV182_001651, partial [Spiromyces aspiralis]
FTSAMLRSPSIEVLPLQETIPCNSPPSSPLLIRPESPTLILVRNLHPSTPLEAPAPPKHKIPPQQPVSIEIEDTIQGRSFSANVHITTPVTGLEKRSISAGKKLKLPGFMARTVPRTSLISGHTSPIHIRRAPMPPVHVDSISDIATSPLASPSSQSRRHSLVTPTRVNRDSTDENLADLISSDDEEPGETDVPDGPNSLTQWFNGGASPRNSDAVEQPDLVTPGLTKKTPERPAIHRSLGDDAHRNFECADALDGGQTPSLSPILGLVDFKSELKRDPSAQMYLHQFDPLPSPARNASGSGTLRRDAGGTSRRKGRSPRGSNSRGHRRPSIKRREPYGPQRNTLGRSNASSRPVTVVARTSTAAIMPAYNHYATDPVLEIGDGMPWESLGYSRFS